MRDFSLRERIIAGVTLALVLCYALAYSLIQPLNRWSAGLEADIARIQGDLTQGQARIAQNQSLDQEYQKLVSVLGNVTTDAADTSALIAALEDAAGQAGIHITNIVPQHISKIVLVKFPVNLAVEGQWPALMKFFHLIQSAPLMCTIDSMNLEKNAGQAETLRGQMVVSKLRINNHT